MEDNLKFLLQKHNKLVEEANAIHTIMLERNQLYGVVVALMKLLGTKESIVDMREVQGNTTMLLMKPQEDGMIKISCIDKQPYTKEEFDAVGEGE